MSKRVIDFDVLLEWYTRKIDGTYKPHDINKPNRYARYAVIFLLICLAVSVLV